MTEKTIEFTEILDSPRPELPPNTPRWLIELVADAWSAANRQEDVRITTGQEMLTTSQVATKLSLNPSTVWRMVRDGRLPARKVGSHYRISASAVRALNDSRMDEMLDAVSDELSDELSE